MAALAAARGGKSAKAVHDPSLLEDAPLPFPTAETADDALSETEPASTQKKTESPALTADQAKSDMAIDWPQLVIQLKLRGVAQQLATQSELLAIEQDDSEIQLHLRVPVETLLSAGSRMNCWLVDRPKVLSSAMPSGNTGSAIHLPP